MQNLQEILLAPYRMKDMATDPMVNPTIEPAWGPTPPRSPEQSEHLRRVMAVLRTYCIPRPKHHGIEAHTVAQRILDAISEPEDSIIRR